MKTGICHGECGCPTHRQDELTGAAVVDLNSHKRPDLLPDAAVREALKTPAKAVVTVGALGKGGGGQMAMAGRGLRMWRVLADVLCIPLAVLVFVAFAVYLAAELALSKVAPKRGWLDRDEDGLP